MNREIKFRGFKEREDGEETIVIEGKKIKGYWVYGDLITGKDKLNNNKKIAYIISPEYDSYDNTIDLNTCASWEVIFETVGQYIGLKDKNENEIYEADIVQEEIENKYIVKFEKERGGYFPFAKGDGCGCCEWEVIYNSKDSKIIGDVYSNPELLAEAEEK